MTVRFEISEGYAQKQYFFVDPARPSLLKKKAVSIATNSLVSIMATKMLLTPTRRVGVNIGQKNAIATNSSID